MLDINVVKKYQAKDGTEKTYSVKIGTGFQNKNGSFTLRFDAYPASPEDWIVMQERQERQGGYAKKTAPAPKPQQEEEDVGF